MFVALKNSLIKIGSLLAVTFVLTCWAHLAFGLGQHSEPKTVPVIALPSKPDDILKLATQMNGLDSGSAKPWHIKISYEQFDSDGDNVSDGTSTRRPRGKRELQFNYSVSGPLRCQRDCGQQRRQAGSQDTRGRSGRNNQSG